jgi:hypothetical protein
VIGKIVWPNKALHSAASQAVPTAKEKEIEGIVK